MNQSFASINFNDPEREKIFQQFNNSIYNNNIDNKIIHEKKQEINFKNMNLQLVNRYNKNTNKNMIMINGIINNKNILLNNKYLFIKYWAANSPNYNSSFSGSALPFPNEKIAYENTPNKNIIPVKNGKFSFFINFPNSYYINLGTKLIPPTVNIIAVNSNHIPVSNIQRVVLGNSIPFRTLTWSNIRNWNNGPLFYNNRNLPIRTQYEILLNSSYPNKNQVPNNFWGLKPAM